ncbi:hypothetical protein ABZ883_18835 [Streptomyces sp. NPDC046977]|uniref:hypothetical protein n=1 Tax=Streptomyces sp. NPDC046977 TaxID=3154703 RepID=UPI00340A1431
MTTRPGPHEAELIARPGRTPDALRMALAQVAPHRLAEMERQKNEAIALSVESGSIEPLRGFLAAWAVHVEIARDLGTAARLRSAEHAAQTLDRDDPLWREATAEIRAIFDEARAAVGG